ncbi:MAG: FtsW/RodA/SpoVE family cell cycle protein [Clostridiaceae bacterium]|nr:FtsW/RodA/SpoVE family cell cycle protein [Clostridiaceae bacterium]
MHVQEIAYLFRYLFVALMVLIVWLMLRLSLAELRWHMKHCVVPVHGFFLRLRQDPQAGGRAARFKPLARAGLQSRTDSMPQFMILPLYHTTCIGRAASCDVRLKNASIAMRHAIIYLYDGVWFLRPAGSRRRVMINGVSIVPATPLEHMDTLTLGDQELTFIDERQAGGQLYDPEPAKALCPAARSGGSLALAWLAFDLFALAGSLLLFYLTPEILPELRLAIGIFCMGLLIMINLYYLLLPLVMRQIDRVLLLCLAFLAFFGLMIQIRLSLTKLDLSVNPLDTTAAARAVILDLAPQGGALLLGFLVLPIIAILVAKTRILEPLGLLCALATPLLLGLTLVLGSGADTHGAGLWITVGGLSLQLTELAKATYLIVLASFFKNRPSLRIQLFFAVWAAGVFFLILMLPDFGSAMILLPTTLLVYVVMTSEYWTTLLILGSGSLIGVLAFSFFPHVQRRISGWTTLWTEVNDSNRQIVYGLQAIGRGGLFGRGLGNGSPGGIPLASSDMVFAIAGEEFGLLAALVIVLFFIILWLRAARVTLIARDGFTSSLALGIGTLFFVEAAVVIAGVTGLLPLTGATLPLIARGGSSILTIMALFAILIGLSARQVEVK